MDKPNFTAYFDQARPPTEPHLTNQTMSVDLFVIWQEGVGYRASKMVEGKVVRYTTPHVELADHFRSEDTARDHLFFTLAGGLPRDFLYSIKPLKLNQKIENTYVVGEASEHNRIYGRDL